MATFCKQYYRWCHCCKDSWIISVFLTVTNNNNSFFNHLVYNKNASPVNPPFPEQLSAQWQTKLYSDSKVNRDLRKSTPPHFERFFLYLLL